MTEIDTERLYTMVGHEIIEKYSLLEDPEQKLITASFKAELMGRKKSACAEMMVDRFDLDMTVQQYMEISYAVEVCSGHIYYT